MAMLCAMAAALCGCRPGVEVAASRWCLNELIVAGDGRLVAMDAIRTSAVGAQHWDRSALVVISMPDRGLVLRWTSGYVSHHPRDWNRDGRRLLVGRFDWRADEPETASTVLALDVRTGDTRVVAADSGSDANWLADGKRVAYDGFIHVGDDETGRDAPSVFIAEDKVVPRLVAADACLEAAVPGADGASDLLFVSKKSPGGISLAVVESSGYAEPTRLAGPLSNPHFGVSPDGQRIAAAHQEADAGRVSMVVVRERRSGNQVGAMRVRDPNVYLRWSPDGKDLMCIGNSGTWVWRPTTGAVRAEVLPTHSRDDRMEATWMPDGRRLLFWQGSRVYLHRCGTPDSELLLDLDGLGL